MSSGSAVPGQSVVLNIVSTAAGTTAPAALQWTMNYPAADISGISVVSGPAATSAGKIVSCAQSGSGTTCVAYGINQTAIPNGTIAVATVQLTSSPADQNVTVQLSGLVAADGDGNAIADSGSGANIAVLPAGPQIGLSCASAIVQTPGGVACSITMTSTLPGGSALPVTVISDSPLMHLPSQVLIPAGAMSATFVATADSVQANENATLTAVGPSNSQSVKVSLLSAASSAAAIAINAGGSAASNFIADIDYAGGGVYANSSSTINTAGVTNPAPQAIYQSERFGNFTYTIPQLTPGAAYTVRLHFAEIYWTQAGQRVFNVNINGAPVLTSFDIVASGGAAKKAIVRQFAATADPNGQIAIQFVTVVDNAKVSGIEVLPAGSQAVAINAGATQVGSFASDEDYQGGGVYANTTTTISTTGVNNPAPQAVYQSERFGNFTYAIPQLMAGAVYTVRLHFAEIYWTQAGQRVFNVNINGAPVLTNFDIVASAGSAQKAVVQQFAITADTNGQIAIQFTTVIDNAKISAIEVVPASSQPLP